jgi:hypothetical protein
MSIPAADLPPNPLLSPSLLGWWSLAVAWIPVQIHPLVTLLLVSLNPFRNTEPSDYQKRKNHAQD